MSPMITTIAPKISGNAPVEIPGFVILGPPRTKKNHGRIISIPTKGARRCHACGHMPGFPRLLPSEQYEIWEKMALDQCYGIKQELARRGVRLPVAGLLSIEALFYRDRASGDVNGFQQALGDLLQKAEIIQNDAQIEDWDGSRRLKDAARPRVEIYITVLAPVAVQEELELRSGQGTR